VSDCRPGRIDHIVELPAPGTAAIKAHFTKLYPDLDESRVRWTMLPGCIVHRIKLAAMLDTEKVIEQFNHYSDNPELALAEQAGEIAHLERIRAMRLEMERQEKEAAKNKPKGVAVTGTDEETSEDLPAVA